MTVAAMYEPARNSLVPMFFTNEKHLKKALTLTGITWSVMASVGASTGGLVTEYVGINACFLIDSATYLSSACFLWMIRGQYVALPTDEPSKEEIASTIITGKDINTNVSDNTAQLIGGYVAMPTDEACKDEISSTITAAKDTDTNIPDNAVQCISLADTLRMMIDGFAYLRSKSWGALVLLKFCACLVYGSADVLNIAFSEKAYGGSNDVALDGSSGRFGILLASVGVGCFVGPIVIEKITDMEKTTTLEAACLVSYLLLGLGYFGMACIGGFAPLCFFNAVWAAGSSIIWIYSSLLLQVRHSHQWNFLICTTANYHQIPLHTANSMLAYIFLFFRVST